MSDESAPVSTRDKILIAAAELLGHDPTARLSVRGVAARAGVSTGSLRHFFPTQRALLDTVIEGLAAIEIPDDPIRDRTRAPAERLLACLHLILEQVGTGERARTYWRKLFETYLATTPTTDDTLAYLALDQLGRHHVERWLDVLSDEGAIPSGDNEGRARFLGTVLNGLVVERALPTHEAPSSFEEQTLRRAIQAVIAHST